MMNVKAGFFGSLLLSLTGFFNRQVIMNEHVFSAHSPTKKNASIFSMEEFELISLGPHHKPIKTQLLFKETLKKDYLH